MKTQFEKNLDDIFDLEDSPSIAETNNMPTIQGTIEHSNDSSKDIESDYIYARENLYGIIENGSNALNTLVAIANASESPRAFEVVGSLIKTLTDANKDLLDIQQKVKKLKEESPSNTSQNVTNNALFIGSTTDLQKLLKGE